jgi:hypothetical protein
MACDLCAEPHFQRGPDWLDPFLCQPGREWLSQRMKARQ